MMTDLLARSRWLLVVLLTIAAAVFGDAGLLREGSAGEITSWPLGYYNQSEGRTWQTVSVPDATCGNGSQFRFRFSQGESGSQRVVFWLPGGGSTMLTRDGELTSNISNLSSLSGLLSAGSGFTGRDRLFTDHSLNDEFIGSAHWVALPYCTQDFHSGRLTEPIEYDFMSQTSLVNEINMAINSQGLVPEELEAAYPGLRIEGAWDNGQFIIEGVFVSIVHRGALNVELALPMVYSELVSAGVNPDEAKAIVAGSSAGGFGAWYNAWRVGDFLHGRPNTTLTLAPMSGSPTSRSWNGAEIVEDTEQRLGLEHRLAWYDVLRPCAQTGAAYTDLSNEPCDDVLDLLDHYRLRWDGMDVHFLPVVNKEDLVAVSGLGDQNDPDFPERLLTLCQTIHRYSQYASMTPETFPYTAWQYERLFTGSNWNVKRVHGFTQATHLVPMLSPNGGPQASENLLGYLNGVAARRVQHSEGAVYIEHAANLVTNVHDPSTTAEPWEGSDQGDYMPDCNVAWPQSFRPPPNGSAVGGFADLPSTTGPPLATGGPALPGTAVLAAAAAVVVAVVAVAATAWRLRSRP